jgi:nitroreductase
MSAIFDMIAVRAARQFFPTDPRLSDEYTETHLDDAARVARLIIKSVNADPDSTKQAVNIPLLGAIDERKREEWGWRVVRDPDHGDALYEVAIR